MKRIYYIVKEVILRHVFFQNVRIFKQAFFPQILTVALQEFEHVLHDLSFDCRNLIDYLVCHPLGQLFLAAYPTARRKSRGCFLKRVRPP